jgi:negative regulator of sigma E activity
MTQSIKEQLSALLDGELPIAEEELLFRHLEKNKEYRQIFGRYSLMAELIQGSSADPQVLGVSERIRVELTEQAAHTPLNVPTNTWSTAIKGLVGAGIAASVAILALISISTLDQDVSQAPAVAELQEGADSYTVPVVQHVDNMAITPARLTNYLVSHGEFFNGPSRLTVDSHMVSKMSGALGVGAVQVEPVEAAPDE